MGCPNHDDAIFNLRMKDGVLTFSIPLGIWRLLAFGMAGIVVACAVCKREFEFSLSLVPSQSGGTLWSSTTYFTEELG